jgi:hypothetical protein
MHNYEFVCLLPSLLAVLLTTFAVVMAWCYLHVTDEPWLCVEDVPDQCDGLTVKGLLFYLDVRSQTRSEKRKTAAALPPLPAPEPEPVACQQLRESVVDHPATRPGEGGPMPNVKLTYPEALAVVEDAFNDSLAELIHLTAGRWELDIDDPEFMPVFAAEIEERAKLEILGNNLAVLRDLAVLPNAPPLTVLMPGAQDLVLHVQQLQPPPGWDCIEGGLSA